MHKILDRYSEETVSVNHFKNDIKDLQSNSKALEAVVSNNCSGSGSSSSSSASIVSTDGDWKWSIRYHVVVSSIVPDSIGTCRSLYYTVITTNCTTIETKFLWS